METTLVHNNQNMIIYGPPGTGKTYHSVMYAVAICDQIPIDDLKKKPFSEIMSRYNELEKAGRIAFTIFHQSYGYEDFIEGVRLVIRNDDSEGRQRYAVQDGIFKKFCQAAMTPEGIEIDQNAAIWFVRLKGKGSFDLKAECFRDDEIRFDGPEDLGDDFSWLYGKLSKMNIGDYVISYGGEGVLIDAIGMITDDAPKYNPDRNSYNWFRKVKWLLKDVSIDVKEINSNRYLPNADIAEVNTMDLSSLLPLIEKNTGHGIKENVKPYVFIIDEINRGDVSKIFGELITLIEDRKRAGAEEAMEALLPYSGEYFSVPKNVYIIGTMNTAERTIAFMDTGLRRRFKFIEMMPDSRVLDDLGIGKITFDGEELNISRMLDVINERIEYFYDREHIVGNAYFTRLAGDPSIDTLADIFEKNLLPLLQEYFHDDYEKIQLILGDNGKEDQYKFVLDKPLVSKDIFNESLDKKGSPDAGGSPGANKQEKKRYIIQHEAFYKIESYRQIGK